MNGQIDCQAFDDRLQERLDERLPVAGDALLEAHAAQCAACEAALQSHVGLIRCVEDRPLPQVSASFNENVLKRLQADGGAELPTRVPPTSSWLADRRLWAAATAMAAVVVLGIALKTSHVGRNEIALAPGQNGTFRGAPRQFGHLPMTSDYPEYRSAIESFATQLPGAMQQLETVDAPGWRPIRATFYAALETLLRTLPGSQPHNGEPQPVTRQAAGVV